MFEATGVAQVLRAAIDVVAHSGTVVVAGTSEQEVSVPSHILVQKEMDLLGSRNNSGLSKEAVDLVRMYRARTERLITQRFVLEETETALEFGAANPDVSNKMIIEVAGRSGAQQEH